MALSLSPQEIVQLGEYPLLRIAPSWKRVRLGDVANVQNGFPFKSAKFSVESGFPLIRIRDVGRGETQHFYTGEYGEEFVVKRGDILIGMDGDFHAARWKGPDALLNQRVCRLTVESEYYDENFFLTCLQPYLNAVNAETSSVTVKHLSSKTVQDIPLPLPPLNEQRLIVEKIEAMFDEIDKGGESLQAALTTLSLYRKSLLKSAFEGRLTADWRAQNADKLEAPETLLARVQSERDTRYKAALDAWQEDLAQWRADGERGKKPAKPKRIGTIKSQHVSADMCPGFPSEWGATRFGDLNLAVSDGPFGSNLKTSDYTDEGVRVIRLENIGYGEFLEEKKSFISKGKYDTIKKHSVYPGTIVVSSFVADAVRSCIVPKSIPLAINKADCFAAVLYGNQTDTKFSGCYLQSPQVFEQVKDLVHGVGRPRINTTQLKELHFPICSPAEQAEIVRILDAQFEAADAMEAEIDAALRRADALRQSILKKAFSGQLVAQDPEEEPASVLLERIKTEKAERAQAAKRNRKSAPPRKPKVRRPTLTDLIQVLKKQKDWISAVKAAQEFGIGDGSASDDIEAFYRQLKDFVEDGAIEVERRGDEDWLRLATAELS